MKFSRRAIINAHAVRHMVDGSEVKLSKAARELCDVSTWCSGRRHGSDDWTVLADTLDALELEDVVCFFCLLLKRDGFSDDYVHEGVLLSDDDGDEDYPREGSTAPVATISRGGAVYLANGYARLNSADGCTIQLENSDDDPTMINATVSAPWANAWAERVGSCEGGTWENCDGEGNMVYDSWIWHPKLVDDLHKDGFVLDMSQYSDCDEEEIAIASHAADCDVCQGCYSQAEEHCKDATMMVAHETITNGS